MNNAIEQMLKAYHVENIYDRKNAMKEIMQEIVLCGLSRAGFFKKAAFYGGTALRIFYGLDRFSEAFGFFSGNGGACVEPFIHDTSVLDIWSADFFKQITKNLTQY